MLPKTNQFSPRWRFNLCGDIPNVNIFQGKSSIFPFFSFRNSIMKTLIIILVAFSLAQGLIIKCQYFRIQWTKDGEALYGCEANVTKMENPKTLEKVKGKHLTNKTIDDVGYFLLKNHKGLEQIPKNFGERFPDLNVLFWINGSLTSLTSDDLKFPKLLSLSLARNHLVSIESDLLKHTRKLEEFYFGFNLLEHVGHEIFNDLIMLHDVDLVANPCIDARVKDYGAIVELSKQLETRCPPLEKESNVWQQCSRDDDECSSMSSADDKIIALNGELKRVNKKLAELEEKFERLEALISEKTK